MYQRLDGGAVHPGHEQGRAVGRPPVAPGAAHLLGRDELGEPIAEPRLPARPDDLGVLAGRQVGDPQRALADVGDPLPGRVGTRVERGSPGRDLPRGGVPRQVRQVDPAGQGERGHRERGVGGESGDAPRPLARPFPDGPLGVGHGPARGAGLGRVGDQSFLAGANVDHPQAGDRIVAALAAQEGHPASVGGDLERAGDAEAEPLGPGLLPREAVGHAPILPAGAPVGSPCACCW